VLEAGRGFRWGQDLDLDFDDDGILPERFKIRLQMPATVRIDLVLDMS
jgi:hypothetical protein